MGTLRFHSRSGSVWSVGGNDQHRLGPAIDRWVDTTAPGANARSVALATSEGQAKVAVKATDVGGGRWRYDSAVMNLDFARARTEGVEPNLRVLNNRGFDKFSVPVSSSTVTDLVFSDGDLDPDNDWVPTVSRTDGITWSALNRSSPNWLNWGVLYRFSFTINQAPTEQTVQLHIANDGSPQSLQAAGMLAPVGAPSTGLGLRRPAQ